MSGFYLWAYLLPILFNNHAEIKNDLLRMEMIVHFPTGDTHLWTLSKLTSYSMMRLSDVIERWDDSITEEKGYKV